MTRILGLVGSLREGSHNRILLEACQRLLPEHTELTIFDGFGALLLFAPDREAPPSVLRFRRELDSADAVLVASPEYAHGVSGVMKNALDWVVTSNQFSGMPVACLNASPASHHAWRALEETLRTMDCRYVDSAAIQATLDSPFAGGGLTAAAIASHPISAARLRTALEDLVAASRMLGTR